MAAQGTHGHDIICNFNFFREDKLTALINQKMCTETCPCEFSNQAWEQYNDEELLNSFGRTSIQVTDIKRFDKKYEPMIWKSARKNQPMYNQEFDNFLQCYEIHVENGN